MRTIQIPTKLQQLKKQGRQFLSMEELSDFLQELGIIRSAPTLRDWCKKYNLGRKIGNTWYGDIDKWEEFVNGPN